MQVIALRKATGLQLQAAAKAARLQDSPNQVHGLVQAIFCSVPSPMQERILRRGLQAVGYVCLKVDEVVKPGTVADRAPWQLHYALRQMCKETQWDDRKLPEFKMAGKTLYATVPANDFADAKQTAKHVLRGHIGFKKLPYLDRHHEGWSKTVKIGKNNWTAVIEASGINVRLSAYKGV